MVLFFALIFPAATYLGLGAAFGSDTYGPNQTSYYDEYTPSFLGIILLNTALFNIAPSLVVYKELGFFKRLFVTPLSINVIVSSTLVKSFMIFILGTAEVFLIGWLMFERIMPAHIFQLIIALIISAFALFSFGFMLGSLFKTANAVFGASVLIFQPMLFLSGSSIPLEFFGDTIRVIANFVPMYHVVDLLRLSWEGSLFTQAAMPAIFISLIMGLICIFVSNKTFERSVI
ncbi:MAG: ABC-2 type transport system permease protein [Arenicella sp.]|jgi:ABC-2 type transport system permease protein